MVGQRNQLRSRDCARRIAVQFPERPEGFGGGQCLLKALEAFRGVFPDDRQDQVVHRLEIIIDELHFQAGFAGSSPRGDRRIAFVA